MDDMHFSFKIENPPAWLPIGRTAENDWRTIEIDCSYWFNMDATGNVVLMYRPSCGMAAYPLLIERDGENIVWHPKSGELVEGVGQMQAFFYVGESKIGSSEMVSCEVDGSLLGGDPGTDPGAVAPPWAIDIIEQIAVLSGHYPKIVNGVLFVWDSDSGEWVQFQGGGGNPNAVLYTEQTLNDSQQAQARENIGAKPPIYLAWDDTVDPGICEKSATEIALLFADGYDVHLPMQAFRGYDLRLRSVFVKDGAPVAEFGGVFIKEDGSLENMTVTVDEQKHIDVVRTHISSAELEISQEIDDWADGKALDAGTAKDVLNQILEEVGDELNSKANTSDIPTKTSELTNDSGYQTASDVQTAIAGKADKTQRITMTAQDTTPTLDPNKFYVFPEMASLAPSLATPSDNTIVNEYHFIFTSGATATTLTLPATINQPDGFTVEANHVYEVSILEGCMTAQGWAVS